MSDVNTETAAPSSVKTDPSNFLGEIIGGNVNVKLHNGVEYVGNLQSIDGYMNIVLGEGKEYFNGNLCRNYGDVFIRGNNERLKNY